MKDPKVGTGKKPKVQIEDYTLMKIRGIQSGLSLKQMLMLELQQQK